MTGQALTITLLAAAGAGFCAGMLVQDIYYWWYQRRYAEQQHAWDLAHKRLSEDDFLYLVKEERP